MPFPSYRFFIYCFIIMMTASCTKVQDSSAKSQGQELLNFSGSGQAPYTAGETVNFIIKSLGVKAGEATLVFEGLQKLDNRDVYAITFRATSANFYDEEKIYADKETFYPVMVKRDLNIWGKKEKIEEEYDQRQGRIKIKKNAGTKTTEQIINKKGPIDNIYCFIYRYRKFGSFKTGETFQIKLPTMDVVMGLEKMDKLKMAGKTYETFFMHSKPKKYKVWFDTSDKKIPLRINGAVGLSDTAMIMVNYQEGKK